MAIIIRRNKPITIKRRKQPNHHSDGRLGEGWPYERGYPANRIKRAYHAIDVNGIIHAFLWEPSGRLGEEWSCGKWSCSPGVMSKHDYKGECSIIFRSSSSTPDDNYRPSRRK
jgi:hypothetical protein